MCASCDGIMSRPCGGGGAKKECRKMQPAAVFVQLRCGADVCICVLSGLFHVG